MNDHAAPVSGRVAVRLPNAPTGRAGQQHPALLVLEAQPDGSYGPAADTTSYSDACPVPAPNRSASRDERWGQVVTYLCTVAAIAAFGLWLALTIHDKNAAPVHVPVHEQSWNTPNGGLDAAPRENTRPV